MSILPGRVGHVCARPDDSVPPRRAALEGLLGSSSVSDVRLAPPLGLFQMRRHRSAPVYDATVDPLGAFIYRVVGPLSPSWKARLIWARSGSERAGGPVVDAVVRRGDVVVDVGANFGLYTDRLARVVGRHGAVYAFEPHPVYTRHLVRIATSRKNVTFLPLAVSDRCSKARLSVPVMDEEANPSMSALRVSPERASSRNYRGRDHDP